jgi:hypothetical protein
MRDKYKERVHIEKMRMLNEILSASKLKEKQAVVTRFNPYFYLMFHDGVKSYEQSEMIEGESYEPKENDETAEVELRLDADRTPSQAHAKGGC